MNGFASSQRGVALIVALLAVALATVLIGGLLDRGELTLARTRNQLREQQAQAYALGLEAYAAKVLMQDQAQSQGYDSADSAWAVPLPPTPVPGGTISAQMSDLDGRFNLNNLDPAQPSSTNAALWLNKFQRLLDALKLDRKLAEDVVAWMQAKPSATAADDAFYLAQQPEPYRAAHRTFSHVSELRLIRGVDGDVYAALVPYVVALPTGTKINVNTASVPVLMTLSQNMTTEMAQAIWQQGHAHFRQLQDVSREVPQLGLIEHLELYATRSDYFLARGQIVLDELPFEFRSVVERRLTGGAGAGVHVIQRSRGTD